MAPDMGERAGPSRSAPLPAHPPATRDAQAPAGLREPACGTWSDSALVAAVAVQDGDAYTELYRRHYASVAATTKMILGAGPACDDVVTGVFLAVWIAPQRFDARRGSLLSYLRMSARGRSIDLLRAESSRKRREQDELQTRAPRAPDASSDVLAFETSAELRRAVDVLPDAEREAIRLAYFGEMSYRTVALVLDEPEGTVKSRIRSALRHLREDARLRLDCDGRDDARGSVCRRGGEPAGHERNWGPGCT